MCGYCKTLMRWWPLGIALLLMVGCADGPFAELAAWNPWIRKQWDQDEQYGPTFHKRIAEMKALQNKIPSLHPLEQQRFSQQLLTFVQDEPSPVIRAEAVKTLSQLAAPEALAGLRFAVSDSEPLVRIAACRAWGKVGGPEAIQHLANAVSQETDLDVRIAATIELGRFRDQSAVQALGIALNDNDPALQLQAVTSLESATGKDFGNSIPAWRDYLAGRTHVPEPQPSLVERIRRLF